MSGGTKPTPAHGVRIHLQPSRTSYRAYMEASAKALGLPEVGSKGKPNKRVLALMRLEN